MTETTRIYVEVSTLLDPAWSGIANVTANLSRALLQSGADVRFFAFDKILATRYVRNALRIADGGGLQILVEHGVAVEGCLHARRRETGREVAIFPNFKRRYQHFDREVLIVHDLSFILTPELHEPGRVRDYMEKIYRDAHAVDAVVCVSDATRRDLVRYYGVPAEKISVAYLGTEAAAQPEDQAQDDGILASLGLASGSFFLMLGTIEPRKNAELIIDYISANPDVLDTFKFAFAGRNGWGRSFQAICAERGVDDPRILHLGYVSELERAALLRNCAALLFPSWFEGFGLPVVEAMALGTPVLGACSSSIVEVGGAPMISFDPGSLDNFAHAMQTFIDMDAPAKATLRARSREQAARFGWRRFQAGVMAAAAPALAAA